jgi:hypothetical protein
MHRFLIIFCMFLCCGFTLVTPEMVRDRENLCEQIRAFYGEKNLTAFVQDVIDKHAEVGGAKLSSSKVGDHWETMDWNPFYHLISVDWAIHVQVENPAEEGFAKFTLFWKCDDAHGVFVEGHRARSGELVLDSIRREETVELNWQ